MESKIVRRTSGPHLAGVSVELGTAGLPAARARAELRSEGRLAIGASAGPSFGVVGSSVA